MLVNSIFPLHPQYFPPYQRKFAPFYTCKLSSANAFKLDNALFLLSGNCFKKFPDCSPKRANKLTKVLVTNDKGQMT